MTALRIGFVGRLPRCDNGRSPHSNANLLPMLPNRPSVLDDEIANEIAANFMQRDGVVCPAYAVEEAPVDHHCQICPNCSHRLTGHKCKLVCTRCGYYLSCAEYY